MCAAFAIPTVGDRKLGLGEELALIVGIYQSVECDASDLVPAVLDVTDGLVEQNLVGLLGVLGDRVFVLLAAETAGGQETVKRERRSSAKSAKSRNC